MKNHFTYGFKCDVIKDLEEILNKRHSERSEEEKTILRETVKRNKRKAPTIYKGLPIFFYQPGTHPYIHQHIWEQQPSNYPGWLEHMMIEPEPPEPVSVSYAIDIETTTIKLIE